MSPQADVHLRRLVEGAVPLGGGRAASQGKGEHALGQGIRARKRYAVSQGRSDIPLPEVGEGFQRLALEVGTRIPGISPDEETAAWRALLDSPSMAVEVAVPNREILLQERITPADISGATLRRVILGTVLHPLNENLDGGTLNAARMAGIAALTVQLGPDGRQARDAWIDVQWPTSARQLAVSLERFVEPLRSRSPGGEVALVIDEERVGLVDDDFEAALRHAAAVSGFHLAVHRHTPALRGATTTGLRRNQPAWLIFVGKGTAINATRDSLADVVGPSRIQQVDTASRAELHEILRENFIALGGVAPSLHLLQPSAPPSPETASVHKMPIDPADCLHQGAGGHAYVRDRTTDLWWTRDTAGHAETVFKSYKLENATLIHEADMDGEGNVIPKFKGDVGRRVAIAGLHPCKHPLRPH